jgi:hypothetical protein
MSQRLFHSYSAARAPASQAPAKPTISKPTTWKDSQIMEERLKQSLQKSIRDIEQADHEISTFQAEIDRLTQLKKESEQKRIREISARKQTEINITYIKKIAKELEATQKKNAYAERCIAFLRDGFDWSDPADEESDNADDTKSDLPFDTFSFTGVVYAPLDQLTSDDVVKIAHYVKACQLLEQYNENPFSTSNDYSDCDTYGELLRHLDDSYAEKTDGDFIVSEVYDCDGNPFSCNLCCHKQYGHTLYNLSEITLDSDAIITGYRRL